MLLPKLGGLLEWNDEKDIADCLSEGYTGVNGGELRGGRFFLAGFFLITVRSLLVW